MTKERDDDDKKGKLPRLPQRNELHLKRKFFHAINGCVFFSVYQFSAVNWIVGGAILLPVVILAWVLEYLRLKTPHINNLIIKFTGPIMRMNEVNKPSGICYFVTGVLIAGALFPKNAVLLAIMYLGWGDPFASAVGILTRPFAPQSFLLSNGKNLIGTMADILFCCLLTQIFFSFYILPYTTLTDVQLQMFIYVGGVIGGMSEVFMFGHFMQTYLNDNLTIPIISAATMTLTAFILGVQL